MQNWDIRDELLSYATLFKSFKSIDLPDQAFYGVGLALTRLSKRLEKINQTLELLEMQMPLA